MNLETFEGVSMNDAIRAVKASFGKDAVILKTEEVRDVDGRRKFLVTATGQHSRSQSAGSSETSDELVEIVSMIGKLNQRFEQVIKNLATKEQVLTLDARLDDVRRIVFDSLNTNQSTDLKGVRKSISNLVEYLNYMELDKGALNKLASYLNSLPEPISADDSEEDYYKSYAIRWMLKRLQVVPLAGEIVGNYDGILVTGSAGSGKSSTVVKMASYFKKNTNRVPKIISFADSQLGAAEQLRIYAKVLNIEFKAVHSFQELEDIAEKQRDQEIMLVDTGSFSPKKMCGPKPLTNIKKTKANWGVFLVLSLAEKASFSDQMVKAVSPLGIDGLIFTMMDEAWKYGDIFNICTKWGIGLSGFGTGQGIPDDYEPATRERVIERIFGLRS